MFSFKKIHPFNIAVDTISIRRGLCCFFTGGPNQSES